MNNPEYILVDEMGVIVNEVQAALSMPVLNYQYGYIKELNETLIQWSKSESFASEKFPLVYMEQPFNIARGSSAGFFGTAEVIRLFIMNETKKEWKAKDRMTNNFKPVIHPIVREILKQIDISVVFHTQSAEMIEHTFTDRYFFGEAMSFLVDAIDCSILTLRKLVIANNPNCTPV
jgi:hypothetical protein